MTNAIDPPKPLGDILKPDPQRQIASASCRPRSLQLFWVQLRWTHGAFVSGQIKRRGGASSDM